MTGQGMLVGAMRLWFSCLMILSVPLPVAGAEDSQLRREAVELLNRASIVSTSAKLPNLERIDNFRFYSPEAGEQQGTFVRKVIQGKGRRDEYWFPNFHAVLVDAHGKLSVARTSETLPEAFEELMTVAPIGLVRFDDEDVIHQIVPKVINGRAARCVEFETIAGENVEPDNEVCMDSKNGSMVYKKNGASTTENLEFFDFAGALMPAKVRYSFKGSIRLDIDQTMRVLTDQESEVLAAPKDAVPYVTCHTSRGPIGIHMPQPKPGTGSGDYFVKIHGMVHADGKVHDAVVLYSSLPSLNEEALNLVSQWTYTAPMCNGTPDSDEVFIELHFAGR